MNAEPVMPSPSYDYDFHELANEYPMMEGEELENLAENIAKHGILDPIIRYQGQILDGRNRYTAAKSIGYRFQERDFKDLAPSLDPEEFVASKNDHRRNLDNKAKRDLIERKINRHPLRSDKEIGKLACCDRKTVKSVRDEMARRVENLIGDFRKLGSHQRQQFVNAVREDLSKHGISPA